MQFVHTSMNTVNKLTLTKKQRHPKTYNAKKATSHQEKKTSNHEKHNKVDVCKRHELLHYI